MPSFKPVTLLLLLFFPFSSVVSGNANANIMVTPLVSGIQSPVAVQGAGDGSGRLFILERSGQILVHRENSEPLVFLDLQDRVGCCGERGLLGIAFHPDFSNNGRFYLNYTNINSDTVIARYRVPPGQNVADFNSEEILLNVEQPFANHNGGELAFGPDGNLYIAIGDGGGSGDPDNNAQNRQSLLGKILRINVDSGQPYSIPPDNPFVGDASTRDEIWALGLRNPYRFSFDRVTGDLYIADVGEHEVEEVNFQPASAAGGQNYGWRRMEGTLCFNPASGCHADSLTLPAFEYANAGSNRCAIIGGYSYRGNTLNEQYGRYIYGDFCSGEIIAASRNADQEWEQEVLLQTSFMISGFGENDSGELFVTDLGGSVYRLTSELSISPATGTYMRSQSIDLSIILRSEATVQSYMAQLNGDDVSGALLDCGIMGTLASGGASLRCPGISLQMLSPGDHTFHIELELSDGRTLSDTVTWQILETSES